ncbi:MAG: hypothetical protein IAE92_00555 [Burkholderiaceae bacterium]|nr:hypothetical protein [Burkholderiaceae bacterium]
MRHPRQIIAWFCIAASLWMGTAFQFHGLAHALQSLEASEHQDSAPGHQPACEKCLLFAAVDGAMPVHAVALFGAPPVALGDASGAIRLHATAFTAYASRAPPQPC